MEKKLFIGSILSIVGGALILACGVNDVHWALADFEGMLNFLSNFLSQSTIEFWKEAGSIALATWYVIFGIVFGILVIVSGVCGGLVRKGSIKAWGVTAIVLSVLSFFSGGGYWIGTPLGIIGGILLLVSKLSV